MFPAMLVSSAVRRPYLSERRPMMGEATAWRRLKETRGQHLACTIGKGGYPREEAAQGATEQDDVISGVDGARKRGLVGVEVAENAREQRLGGRGGGVERSLDTAVELEELREQREDESEGDLGTAESASSAGNQWQDRLRVTYQVQQQRNENDPQDPFAGGRVNWGCHPCLDWGGPSHGMGEMGENIWMVLKPSYRIN